MDYVNRIRAWMFGNMGVCAWIVGYRRAELGKTILDGYGEGFHWIKPTREGWYADPITRVIDGRLCIFVEKCLWRNSKGEISLICVDSNNYSYTERTIISEPFHLSYPEIFEYNGSRYMIPESSEKAQIRVYKQGEDINEWKLVNTFDTENKLVDTVVSIDNSNNILLLASDQAPDNPFKNRLHFYKMNLSDSPEMSEINIGSRHYDYESRNGGSLIAKDGNIYRVIQDSEDGQYGRNILIKKVDKLDKDGFEEQSTSNVVTVRDIKHGINRWNYKFEGIHTYGIQEDGLEVIDARVLILSFETIIRWLKKKIKERFPRKLRNK